MGNTQELWLMFSGGFFLMRILRFFWAAIATATPGTDANAQTTTSLVPTHGGCHGNVELRQAVTELYHCRASNKIFAP